ncbi:ribonuclease Z [Flammeovirga pectinis]|uniref:Ribonuclease Z n=1 Tax=Flammeovirga pectinis TaxID=2494373 RepID=A0A3S9P387_9BACT|nr:ribonuclease Z [Flammeovirga pectinis]AZQ62661.1 ribonuclease Z [Flammeovirga pectinis]
MSFEITILGSSAAVPVKGRHMTSQHVRIGNQQFLIDCGEATQHQLINLGISLHKIEHIFISHLHGDHFFGLPGLLSTMNMQRRTDPLYIHGPRGLDEVLLANFKHTKTDLSFKVFLYDNPTMFPEVIYENEKLTVETIPLTHRVPCTGFLFREKQKQYRIIPEKLPSGLPFEAFRALKRGEDIDFQGEQIFYKNVTLPPRKSRSYAFCSDTKYSKSVISKVYGVDLLYHESTFMHRHLDRANTTFHTTAHQAGTVAKEAKVGELLIGHFSARYGDLNNLLEEAREEFPNTELAKEGKQFTILERE